MVEREGGCGIDDSSLVHLNVPAYCQMEGRSAGQSTFVSISMRRCRQACCRGRPFDSFCGGHLFFVYVCSTGVLALFIGVSTPLHAYVEEGWKQNFPAVFWLALVSSMRDCFGRGRCLHIYYRGLGVDVYMLYVYVHGHTHTLHVGYSDVSADFGTRHLESPEEIQCTVAILCIYTFTVQCTKHT